MKEFISVNWIENNNSTYSVQMCRWSTLRCTQWAECCAVLLVSMVGADTNNTSLVTLVVDKTLSHKVPAIHPVYRLKTAC